MRAVGWDPIEIDQWIAERLNHGPDPLSRGLPIPSRRAPAGRVHHFNEGRCRKTTTAANLGGFRCDAGLKALLLDLDVQPTLSLLLRTDPARRGGIYGLLAFNERDEAAHENAGNRGHKTRHVAMNG